MASILHTPSMFDVLDDRLFILFTLYLLFFPLATLSFHLLLRYMRRRGFIERETAEGLLHQCHNVLLHANDSLTLSRCFSTCQTHLNKSKSNDGSKGSSTLPIDSTYSV
jgi:hypothetical protein